VTVSTVALRFHYGVDVLAGFAWAWTAAMLARLSSPVHSANRRSTAEQNSFWPEEKQIAPSTRIPARGFPVVDRGSISHTTIPVHSSARFQALAEAACMME